MKIAILGAALAVLALPAYAEGSNFGKGAVSGTLS